MPPRKKNGPGVPQIDKKKVETSVGNIKKELSKIDASLRGRGGPAPTEEKRSGSKKSSSKKSSKKGTGKKKAASKKATGGKKSTKKAKKASKRVAEGKKARRRRPKSHFLRAGLAKIFAETDEGGRVTVNARKVLNDFLEDIATRIGSAASDLLIKSGKQTVDAKTIKAATKLVLHSKDLSLEGDKAVTKYQASKS